jgi:predicted nucleic acid-binding Zn ribbon protein
MEDRSDKLQNLPKIVQKMGDELQIAELKEYYEALKDWEGLVGKKLAEHTKPLFIENRVLHVATDGSAWSQEISFRRNAIMQGVNNRLGRNFIREVKCKAEEKKKRK